APEGAADGNKRKPCAARHGKTCTCPGRRAELQQQLALLGHIRAGNEIKIIPGDPGSNPSAASAPSCRADAQILPSEVPPKRRNSLNTELQRQRRDISGGRSRSGSEELVQGPFPLWPLHSRTGEEMGSDDEHSSCVFAVARNRTTALAAVDADNA